MTGLERLAYAIARGVAKAWFEEARKAETAQEETPVEEDRARADRFRDAVGGLRLTAYEDRGGDPR